MALDSLQNMMTGKLLAILIQKESQSTVCDILPSQEIFASDVLAGLVLQEEEPLGDGWMISRSPTESS